MPERYEKGLGRYCDGAPHADWCKDRSKRGLTTPATFATEAGVEP